VLESIHRADGLGGLWLIHAGHSCENENTIKSQITRGGETALATVWKSLVRGVHDTDYWEFAEGWHSYVPLVEVSLDIQMLTEL